MATRDELTHDIYIVSHDFGCWVVMGGTSYLLISLRGMQNGYCYILLRHKCRQIGSNIHCLGYNWLLFP